MSSEKLQKSVRLVSTSAGVTQQLTRAVAGKLDKDYLACLVSEARLPQTRPQFSREVAAFSTGWFRLHRGVKSTTNIDSGDSRPALPQSISKNPAIAPSALTPMKEKL